MKIKEHSKFLLFLPIILYLIFAGSLVYVQKPHEDEMIPTLAAVNLTTKGYIAVPQVRYQIPYSPFWKGIDRYSYQYPPLSILVQAGWFSIFGFGLFTTRFLSVVFGLIGLISWYYILKHLNIDKKFIFIALILISVDFIYTRFSASGRLLEIMCAALSFASWASYLTLRKKSFIKALLISNILVVLSGLTHQNGILGFTGLVFLILYHDRYKLKPRYVVLSIVPYIIAGMAWGYYILQDLDAFQHQFISVTFGSGWHKTSMGLNLEMILGEIRNRYLFAYGFSPEFPLVSRLLVFILIIYLCSFIGLISKLKKHYPARLIFVLITIYFLLLMFVVRPKWPMYLTHIVPLYTAGVVIFWSLLKTGFVKQFISISILIMILLSSGVNLYRIKRCSYHKEYLPDIRMIKQFLKPTDIIMGPLETSFDLGFDIVALDYTLGYYYYIKSQPNFIVIDHQRSERIFSSFSKNKPEIYSHIQDVLKNKYNLVYQGKLYKVYKKVNTIN